MTIPINAPTNPSQGVDYYLDGMIWRWNGSTFYVIGAQPQAPYAHQPPDVPSQSSGAAAFLQLSTKVTADAYNRYELYSDGTVATGDGTSAPVVDYGAMDGFLRTSAQESIPRRQASTTSVLHTTSGHMKLTYWRAKKNFAGVANITTKTGGTAAGATPTLIKLAVFSIAGNGDGTLLGVTASNTALYSTTFQALTTAFVAPFNLSKGALYATANLVVTGAALPTYYGVTGADHDAAPREAGTLTGQTDIPASFLGSAITNNNLGLQYTFLT